MVLAGAKIARLLPFLHAKGFNAEAFAKGTETMARLRAAPCHLLLFELECSDMMGVDLARATKIERLAGATLLVDDPMKSGMIIAALSRGVDSYVSLPPDETVFFDRIEGLLLAQWGLVMQQQQQGLVDELAQVKQQLAAADASADSTSNDTERRLREQLMAQEVDSAAAVATMETKLSRLTTLSESSLREMTERFTQANRRVFELTKETGVLRDQLSTMHLVAGVKTGTSDEGAATRNAAFDDGDETNTMREARRSPATLKATAAKAAAAKAAPTKTTKTATPGPVSGVGKSVGNELTDDFQLADLPVGRDATSDAVGTFDESTQAIPASLARALLDDDAAFAGSVPATRPGRPIAPPGSSDQLGDFMPKMASFGTQVDALRPPSPLDMDLGGGALLDDLEQVATSSNSFGDAGDVDARTMAVPAQLAFMMATCVSAGPGDFNFDERNPAAGVGRAPPVPKSVRFGGNDEDTAPRGIEFASPAPRNRPADHLNTQLLKDASRIPSIGDEEVEFLDDD